MDILTVCIFLILLFGILLYYVTRETSYEQAIEEQRNKNEFDLLTSGSNSGTNAKHETKKEKSKKSKESVASKKSKESKLVAANNNVNSKMMVKQNNSTATAKNNNQSKLSVNPSVPNDSNTQPSSTSGQEPIIVYKKENVQHHPTPHPTKKSHQIEPKITSSLLAVQETAPKASVDDSISNQLQDVPKVNPNQMNKNNDLKISKKSKNKIITKATKDFNMDDIIESIKLLSKEDVTILTDYLLNMQSEDQIDDLNWHKKNDPVESLKKQLAEKEETIHTQRNNLDSAKRKLDSLQYEIYSSKRQYQNEIKARKEIENERNRFEMIINDVNQKLSKQKQQIEGLEEQIRLANQNELSKVNTIHDLKQQVKQQQLRIAETEKLLDEYEEKNKMLDMNKENIIQMKEEFEKEKIELEDNFKKASNVKQKEIERLMTETNTANSKVEGLQKETKELRKELDELKSTANEKKDLILVKEQLSKENDELRQKLDDTKDENKILSNKIDELNKCERNNANIIKSISAKLNPADGGENGGGNNFDQVLILIDDLQENISKYEQLAQNYSKLNESNRALVDENETLQKQLQEKVDKCEHYETTLAETDATLLDIQDKILNQKNHYELELSKKLEEIAAIKEEMKEQRDRLAELNNENAKLKENNEEINELYLKKKNEITEFQNEKELLLKEIADGKLENINLKKNNEKLNELMQIGVNTYEEEKRKNQDLERRLQNYNGNDKNNDNNCAQMPTANGN